MKAKIGNSSLYMTPEQFAALVVDALEEQNYFKRTDTAHPQDLAYAFTTVGETIGTAMAWAITEESKFNKEKKAVMEPNDLKKAALPVDDEIAPLSYSEWKKNF